MRTAIRATLWLKTKTRYQQKHNNTSAKHCVIISRPIRSTTYKTVAEFVIWKQYANKNILIWFEYVKYIKQLPFQIQNNCSVKFSLNKLSVTIVVYTFFLLFTNKIVMKSETYSINWFQTFESVYNFKLVVNTLEVFDQKDYFVYMH